MNLTEFEIQLLIQMQRGLEISDRPFAVIGEKLNYPEKDVLKTAKKLMDRQIIRQIVPRINYRRFGYISTLVTTHIEKHQLEYVKKNINCLENVSHNYLRNHHFNLWFTLQAKDQNSIEVQLSELSKKLEIQLHSLPAKRFFKLNVFFDPTGREQHNNQSGEPENTPIKLTDEQKTAIVALQKGLLPVEKPFELLASGTTEADRLVRIAGELVKSGIISKIAASVNHRKMGFRANSMLCCSVPQEKSMAMGRKLASLKCVSHCYERQTFAQWPYNIFAMVHAKNKVEIKDTVDDFVQNNKIGSFVVLDTVAELKKQAVRYRF